MNEITIKNTPHKLNKDVITKGSELQFKATDKDGNDVSLSSYKGLKVVSVFPDINTRICDAQTQSISKLAYFNKDINFISVTMDDTETIAAWCAANGVENINILSDAKHKEFGEATGLYIPDVNKLARGFIILDDNNKILDIAINKEVAEDPDYSLVDKYIEKK